MTDFDDRERAFEKKFELDEEIKFKIASRTAKLFGQWVAAQLGLKGAEAETYAAELRDISMAKGSRDALVARAEKDLHTKGVTLSRHRLEKEIEDFHRQAREQLGGDKA